MHARAYVVAAIANLRLFLIRIEEGGVSSEIHSYVEVQLQRACDTTVACVNKHTYLIQYFTRSLFFFHVMSYGTLRISIDIFKRHPVLFSRVTRLGIEEMQNKRPRDSGAFPIRRPDEE